MKELLSRAGVPFTAKNVDEDEHAYDELIARGMRTVPVTVIGERVLAGFHPVELVEAIEAWRGGRS